MAGAPGTPPETLGFPWFPLHSAWPSEKICTVAFYLSTEPGHEAQGSLLLQHRRGCVMMAGWRGVWHEVSFQFSWLCGEQVALNLSVWGGDGGKREDESENIMSRNVNLNHRKEEE